MRFKDILIIALVVSACYLAGQLWFERIASNRNFFYTIVEAVAPFGARAQVGELVMVEPLRIVKMFGNMTYRVDYNIREADSMSLAAAGIEAAMREGRYTHSGPADWGELLVGEGLILEYALSLPIDVLRGLWGITGGDVLARVDVFDSVMVLPGLAAGDGVRIVFVDGSDDGFAYFFEVWEEDVRAGIRRELGSVLGQAVPVLHSASSDTGIFSGNAFIPSFAGDAMAYEPLRIVSPYANHSGDILLGSLFGKIAPLFDTPAAVSRLLTPGEFIFSDENTVVRFSQDYVMEFTSYRTSRHRQVVGISEALTIAMGFLEADEQLLGRVYLSGILEDEGDFTFLFDHVAEGFPVIVPQSLLERLQLRAPIEVVVRSGVVTNYRKWAVAFEGAQGERSLATTGFWEAYDRVLDGQGIPLPEDGLPRLHRAALAFYASPEEQPIGLVWQLHVGPARFIVRD